MSWKDKIREALFEEESVKNEAQKTASSPLIQSPVQVQAVSSTAAPITITSGQHIEIDEKLLDKIEAKLKEANIPGPDYLELKEAAEEKTLVADEPDEAKRWRQAFRNMKVFFPQSGLNKQKLLSAVDHYISIIKAEINRGLSELETVKNRDVTQETSAVKNLEKEIQVLEKQLAEKQKLKAEKEAAIQANLQKCEHQGNVFKTTTGFVLNMLEKDKEKINNYIID